MGQAEGSGVRRVIILCGAVGLSACVHDAPGPGARRPEGREGPGRAALMPDRDEQGERTDEADRAWTWRSLRWRDEHGKIAPGSLRRALEQRTANLVASGARDNG